MTRTKQHGTYLTEHHVRWRTDVIVLDVQVFWQASGIFSALLLAVCK